MWVSGRPGYGGNMAQAFLWQPYCVWPSIILLKNACCQPCHGWQHMRLKNVSNISLDCQRPSINISGDLVSYVMASHTITKGVGAVSRCKPKRWLKRTLGGLHARTRLSSLPKLILYLSLKTNWFHSFAFQSRRARYHSKPRRRCADVIGRR